jgi:hypothetical protein
MQMKSSLVFDTTSLLDSDNVGAFLRASDGTLLTHTDVGGKKALDVRVAEGINVEVDLDFADDSVTAHQGGTWVIDSITNPVTVTATDLDIRDLAFATDKVDVTGSEVSLDAATLAALESITVQNGAGAAAVNIQDGGNSITVDAADLDIRDLAFATDKVDVSGSSVSITGDVNVTQGTSPWVVSATDLDIRDLSAAQDSVQSNLFDGAGVALTSTLVGADQALDVNVVNSISVNDVALANVGLASAAVSTAGNVVASPLADRKYLFVANNGNQKIYLGPNGVTTGTGFPVGPGSYIEFRAGAAIDLEFAQTGGTIDVRSLELK